MSQEHIDTQERIDELYDKWEAEYQKRAALIHALEALCASWSQANRDAPPLNAIAHMTERRKCESALEDIIRKAKGE